MAQAGLIIGIIGAVLVVADLVYRVTSMTNVIDGGSADTDFDAELRRDKVRALATGVPGPVLVVVGAVLVWIGD